MRSVSEHEDLGLDSGEVKFSTKEKIALFHCLYLMYIYHDAVSKTDFKLLVNLE